MSSEAEAKVVVITCAGCGAPVAMGDRTKQRCEACGAEVALPEEHVALRRVEARHGELDEEARSLAERIGEAPSPLLQLLTVFESSCAFPFLILVLLFPSFFAARWLLRMTGGAFGRVLEDDERLLVITSNGVMLALFAAGLLGATYASRRLAGLRQLQAGLSAKPPSHPGGPATCRACGADLEIAAGARGAGCRYCGSENLVAVDARWVARARESKKKLGASLRAAFEAHRDELARLRRSFRFRLAGLTVVGGGLFVLMSALILSTPPARPETPEERLTREALRPRLILDRDYVGGGSDVYFSPLLATRPCEGADPGTRSFRFTKIGCDETRCIAPWYVALRRDDTLRLETSADYEGLVLVYPQSDAPPFSKEGRGELAKKGWVKPGAAVDFVAPANGWYLLLFSIDGARPEVAYDLCAELVRAR